MVKRNVILIAVDTLRADHLGCYGYFRNTSPTADELARRGVLFLDMHSTAIATGPAFASIMTGLYPIYHHCYMIPYNLFNLFNMDDKIRTFPEIVCGKGYVTVRPGSIGIFFIPKKKPF